MTETTEQLDIKIVNPNKVVYEGTAKRIFLPGRVGELAVMPYHTPLYSELVSGELKIELENGSEKIEKIEGGVARIRDNAVTILIGF